MRNPSMKAEARPEIATGAALRSVVAGYGLFWFLGSALMGVLYDASIAALVVFSVVMQLGSIPMLLLVRRELARAPVQ